MLNPSRPVLLERVRWAFQPVRTLAIDAMHPLGAWWEFWDGLDGSGIQEAFGSQRCCWLR